MSEQAIAPSYLRAALMEYVGFTVVVYTNAIVCEDNISQTEGIIGEILEVGNDYVHLVEPEPKEEARKGVQDHHYIPFTGIVRVSMELDIK